MTYLPLVVVPYVVTASYQPICVSSMLCNALFRIIVKSMLQRIALHYNAADDIKTIMTYLSFSAISINEVIF